MVEITSEKQNKIKIMKSTDDSLRDFWDNIKCTNIWIIGVKGMRNFLKIIVENFPNMEMEIVNSKRHKEPNTG